MIGSCIAEFTRNKEHTPSKNPNLNTYKTNYNEKFKYICIWYDWLMYCWVTRNHEHTYSIISKTLESKLICIPIYITHTHKYEYNYPYMWKKEICSCSSEIREKNPLLKLYYMLIKYTIALGRFAISSITDKPPVANP